MTFPTVLDLEHYTAELSELHITDECQQQLKTRLDEFLNLLKRNCKKGKTDNDSIIMEDACLHGIDLIYDDFDNDTTEIFGSITDVPTDELQRREKAARTLIAEVFHANVLRVVDSLEKRLSRGEAVTLPVDEASFSKILLTGPIRRVWMRNNSFQMVAVTDYGKNARRSYLSKECQEIHDRWPTLIRQLIYTEPKLQVYRSLNDDGNRLFRETFDSYTLHAGKIEDLITLRYASACHQTGSKYEPSRLDGIIDSSREIDQEYLHEILKLSASDLQVLAYSVDDDSFIKLVASPALNSEVLQTLAFECFVTGNYERGEYLAKEFNFTSSQLFDKQALETTEEAEDRILKALGKDTASAESLLSRFEKAEDAEFRAECFRRGYAASPEVFKDAFETLPTQQQLELLLQVPEFECNILKAYRTWLPFQMDRTEKAQLYRVLAARQDEIPGTLWSILLSQSWEDTTLSRSIVELLAPPEISCDFAADETSFCQVLHKRLEDVELYDETQTEYILRHCPEALDLLIRRMESAQPEYLDLQNSCTDLYIIMSAFAEETELSNDHLIFEQIRDIFGCASRDQRTKSAFISDMKCDEILLAGKALNIPENIRLASKDPSVLKAIEHGIVTDDDSFKKLYQPPTRTSQKRI